MSKIPVIWKHFSESCHSILFEVFYCNMFRYESSKRVDNRTISNLLFVLWVWIVPLVAIHFEKSLHQKLRPQFLGVLRTRKQGLRSEITRNSVIDFNQSLFTHEPNLYPILATWWNYRCSVLLWINSLPYFFIRVNIFDKSIFRQLELRSYPFSVSGHAKA